MADETNEVVVDEATPVEVVEEFAEATEAVDGDSVEKAATVSEVPVDELDFVKMVDTLKTDVTTTIEKNYADHAKEMGSEVPKEPIIFHKTLSCMQGPNDEVMLPKGSVKTDWEIELGMVIGSRASYVTKKNALSYVAGYVLANDVSERAFQMERGGLWDKGKGCDSFGPVGPWLVTSDEVPNPQRLSMWLDVNGERMQSGSTKTMIFDCASIVSYVSQFMTLLPGDLIITGTPPGVGHGFKPPRYLKAGDVMSMGIEGLGEAHQQVVKYKAA
nr:FAA hydrolase family protein [Betaproteobacteria bacterium]